MGMSDRCGHVSGLSCSFDNAAGRFSDCAIVNRESESSVQGHGSLRGHACVPHHGFQCWSSSMYGSILRSTPLPIGPREINQPPPLRDFAPRQPRREFRSGNGLLLPSELGFFLPHRQHKHSEFSCGCHCCLREASASCKANSPALQSRKFPHSCDKGVAASNSRLRMTPSPHFNTRPDQSTAPDWCRFGVSPRWAPASEVLLNRAGSSISAMKFNDTTGPTPGMVIRRRAMGWSRASFFTAASRSAAAWHAWR